MCVRLNLVAKNLTNIIPNLLIDILQHDGANFPPDWRFILPSDEIPSVVSITLKIADAATSD